MDVRLLDLCPHRVLNSSYLVLVFLEFGNQLVKVRAEVLAAGLPMVDFLLHLIEGLLIGLSVIHDFAIECSYLRVNNGQLVRYIVDRECFFLCLLHEELAFVDLLAHDFDILLNFQYHLSFL